MPMSSNKKKHNKRDIFDTIQEIERHDQSSKLQLHQSKKRHLERSQAAQSQTKLYQGLLECRILLQRALTATDGNSSAEKVDDNNNTTEPTNQLLADLLQARHTLLCKGNEESEPVDFEKLVQDPKQLDQRLQSDYEQCRQEWQTVLNRRHKEVRLQSGQWTSRSQTFRVLESSFWEQVEHTVQHEQLFRSQNKKEECCCFDDTKLYQQMLKDFCATHPHPFANGTPSKRSTKQQNSNNSAKVDRKASKGRKIRYHELPKLVNFTFPLARASATTDLDQDAWFKSLFGGAGAV